MATTTLRSPRIAALAVAVCALTACGSTTTAPTTTTAFALDAGNYTLKLSGGGTSGGAIPNVCSASGSGVKEGSVAVIVSRTGTAWSARPAVSPDANWAMTFTTDGAAAGTVAGSMGGPALDPTANTAMSVTRSAIDGRNSGANIAGGAIQGTISFTAASGGATCTLGTWTLTPR
ncbi:MAG: hypothetical protein WCQ64_12395 [Acidobacteriota bacterium]